MAPLLASPAARLGWLVRIASPDAAAPPAARLGWLVRIAPASNHLLAAARMREARARQLALKSAAASADGMNKALGLMRSTGLLLDTKVRATLAKGGKILLQGLSKTCNRSISHRAACSIAFHSITRRGDLARIYRVAPATVTRVRCVVAHITWRCDAALHAGISALFGRQAPLVFVSGTYCDGTKEKLLMPMRSSTGSKALLLPSVTKSSWNVLVSSQRFAWCFDSERQQEWY
jgi:hypothetical protein